MLKTRIIPCLDVADGRVVKGVNFVDLIDAGDPVESARAYDAAGADELCFLDIHATHENRGTMYDLATRTAEQCFMPLTIGGGVRTVDDVRNLLLAGADKVSFNSAAVANPVMSALSGLPSFPALKWAKAASQSPQSWCALPSAKWIRTRSVTGRSAFSAVSAWVKTGSPGAIRVESVRFT